jgi:hypothetical protein
MHTTDVVVMEVLAGARDDELVLPPRVPSWSPPTPSHPPGLGEQVMGWGPGGEQGAGGADQVQGGVGLEQ